MVTTLDSNAGLLSLSRNFLFWLADSSLRHLRNVQDNKVVLVNIQHLLEDVRTMQVELKQDMAELRGTLVALRQDIQTVEQQLQHQRLAGAETHLITL
jgi:predicted  nucleic acid-binding Zn-ribbon protein